MNFQAAGDIQSRIEFMRLDAAACKALLEAWALVEPKLPEILEGFYAHVAAVPALAALVGTQSQRLKQSQSGHWRRLFSGRFDQDYFASVRAIGLIHNKIGLEPRWYIGGYRFVLAQLTDLAVDHYRWRPQALKTALQAISGAVLLDMDIAISTYQDALVADRMARGKRLGELLVNFDSNAQQLLSQVGAAGTQLQTTSKNMAAVATQTRGQSASVASASEEASVNVQTVAAAAEELSRSVGEILAQVSSSSQAASRAEAEAERTNESVLGLVENAEKISAVVQLIQSIAGQTNLLALNATIEAARAGEAGKGFAVVANEVKSLANQTARATEEIAQAVTQIQAATRAAGAAIQGIGETISHLNTNAAAIAESVEQQGHATREIAHAVQEAAQGARDVARNIVGVNKAADEAGVAAEEVMGAAAHLDRNAGDLSAAVRDFIQLAKAV